VWRRREQIPGYELVHQAPFLRHFTARLKPLAT
jgi:tryptophanase